MQRGNGHRYMESSFFSLFSNPGRRGYHSINRRPCPGLGCGGPEGTLTWRGSSQPERARGEIFKLSLVPPQPPGAGPAPGHRRWPQRPQRPGQAAAAAGPGTIRVRVSRMPGSHWPGSVTVSLSPGLEPQAECQRPPATVTNLASVVL